MQYKIGCKGCGDLKSSVCRVPISTMHNGHWLGCVQNIILPALQRSSIAEAEAEWTLIALHFDVPRRAEANAILFDPP